MKPGKFYPNEPLAGHVIYEVGTSGELEVIHYQSKDGHETMLTHWYPTKDEIRKLIKGKPVQLHIVGNRHPWVKIDV